ncbi:b(0,+)-type amino acid transporter 1-like isoform X2 [Physella acuta]|nr:b(0,+)-type amino acid transporter 1-like isoform X2 [Physella acuta]XP_059162476.1 b(0,+)-type amino acid transporter 1-like isoform X2 [Physella acuta]
MKENSSVKEKVELKRELGLIGATSIVIGSIIGSGIFISPKGVLEASGSVALCMIVWVIAGIIALCDALCYAELGTLIPKSGGTYTYLFLGFGKFVSFLYIIQATFIITPGVFVVFMLTFAKYLVSVIPTCGSPELLEKFLAAAGLITLYLVNCFGTRYGAHVSIITTFCKLLALAVIIVTGLVAIAQGTTNELGTGFSGTSRQPASLALALYSAIWATSGGDDVTRVVEEIKNPTKSIPRALIFGILVVVVMYILTNIAYIAVMTKTEMIGTRAVAVLFAQRTLGPAAGIIPMAVVISTLGTTSISLLSSSRMTYAAARDGILPDLLSYIQVDWLTPVSSMTTLLSMSLLWLAFGEIGSIINYLGFLGTIFKIAIYVALIKFRYRSFNHVKRIVKVPLLMPVLMILMNIYLFLAPLIIEPQIEYVYVGGGFIVCATLLYLVFIHFHFKVPFYDNCVTVAQLVFRLSPPFRNADTD